MLSLLEDDTGPSIRGWVLGGGGVEDNQEVEDARQHIAGHVRHCVL